MAKISPIYECTGNRSKRAKKNSKLWTNRGGMPVSHRASKCIDRTDLVIARNQGAM